jgi:hypothetical protein
MTEVRVSELGFNSIYDYSYSDINKFEANCEIFFRHLDKELSINIVKN